MTTRTAYAPVWQGLSAAAFKRAQKVAAYINLLADAFAEAREQARIAQSRRVFISE